MDAVVCTLPSRVLMLSGYWPVVGTSIAIVTSEGFVVLVAPEDERDLALNGWADEVRFFAPGSLSELSSSVENVYSPLSDVAATLGLAGKTVIGYEADAVFEPVSYAAMHLYGAAIRELLHEIFPAATLKSASDLITRLRSTLTSYEVERVRTACRIAETAFKEGAKAFHAGLSELEVAALFRTPLSTQSFAGVERADGFTYCMSGPNSVCAYASYQRSTSRKVETGDLMLVHCNSYADGYWTDITRTFCIGEADERKLKMYDAVLAARTAALASIRAGVKAAAVDEAAREVMIDCGFGQEFRHGLGHCVGYAAINHNAPPRLHPRSDDVLATGMVFNVEPACYIDGFGGLRHCDMVLVTATGAEVLTPFQNNTRDLTLH